MTNRQGSQKCSVTASCVPEESNPLNKRSVKAPAGMAGGRGAARRGPHSKNLSEGYIHSPASKVAFSASVSGTKESVSRSAQYSSAHGSSIGCERFHRM